jgi:hypothetical protein
MGTRGVGIASAQQSAGEYDVHVSPGDVIVRNLGFCLRYVVLPGVIVASITFLCGAIGG